MATSGGGFAASGLLQGFASAYNQAYQRRTQQDLEQRHQLAGSLAAMYPNARPEAQQDIAQRLLSIYSTPIGKKLDKKLSDVSTLGASQIQAGQAQGQAQANAGIGASQNAVQGQMAGQGVPSAPPSAAPPSGGLPAPPDIQGSTTAQTPVLGAVAGQAPAIPAPPPYSPLMSPEEKNQVAAAAISSQKTAEINAESKARMDAYQAWRTANPQGTPQEFLLASGRGLPVGSFIPHILSKNVQGSDLLAAHPDIVTMGGEQLDPKQYYDVSSVGGQAVAVPAGLGAQVALSNMNNTPFKSYMNEGLKQGMPRAQLINQWNDREAVNHGFKMVPQTDGSIKMMPVTTTTETSRGQLPAPPGTSPKGGGGAGASSSGTVVGGKLPPEVAKAQSTYLGSIERYNVMSSALPKALAGDQQAMINLLYNHIGMTIGLQKGARITQDIINEAQHSAPWMATLLAKVGVGNGFTMDPTMLRGVTIPPETMQNMIGLAEDRVNEDYNNFQSQKTAYAGGGVPTPDQVVAGGKSRQSGQKPKPISSTPPPSSGGTVMMRAPNGQSQAVPADQVEHYKSLGATVVQ